MRKLLSVLLVLVLVAGAATLVAEGQKEDGSLVIRAGHGQPQGTGLHMGFVYFKEAVEEMSDGAITVEIFDSGQLGGDRELTEGVQLGNVQMTAVSATNLAPFSKEFFVLDTYFMFRDREHVYSVLDGKAGDAMLAPMDDINIKGLGYWENGFRHFTNSIRPVEVPEDMRGIKMRVPENPVQIGAWKSVGAGPTPMAWGELFTALQQKTLDGQESTLESILTMKFYEVQPYISITGHKYSPYVILMNKEFYDGMSAEQQGWVNAAIEDSLAKQRAFAKEAEQKAIDAIREAGNTIVEPTVEQKLQFRKIMASTYDLVKKNSGEEIFELYLSEVEAN
jgi:tripartite ATP-independent transporter DctP family solute receptor